jgi:hypothetical protein
MSTQVSASQGRNILAIATLDIQVRRSIHAASQITFYQYHALMLMVRLPTALEL